MDLSQRGFVLLLEASGMSFEGFPLWGGDRRRGCWCPSCTRRVTQVLRARSSDEGAGIPKGAFSRGTSGGSFKMIRWPSRLLGPVWDFLVVAANVIIGTPIGFRREPSTGGFREHWLGRSGCLDSARPRGGRDCVSEIGWDRRVGGRSPPRGPRFVFFGGAAARPALRRAGPASPDLAGTFWWSLWDAAGT